MSDIILGPETESTAYFCPKCGNPVTVLGSSVTLGRRVVACSGCGWGGTEDQTAQSSFKHGFKNDSEIAEAMTTDLRNLLSKSSAVAYGRFLLKWGFMDMPVSALQLAQYLEAVAGASVEAIVALRKSMVEEKTRERSGA